MNILLWQNLLGSSAKANSFIFLLNDTLKFILFYRKNISKQEWEIDLSVFDVDRITMDVRQDMKSEHVLNLLLVCFSGAQFEMLIRGIIEIIFQKESMGIQM